jgi:hypothetical protein
LGSGALYMLIYSTVSIRLEIKIKIKKKKKKVFRVWCGRETISVVCRAPNTPLSYSSLEISRNTSTK